MLIYEIFHKTAVNEAFPVKGMAAKPAPAGLSTSSISDVMAKGAPTKPTLGSRIKNAASAGMQAVKSAGSNAAEYLALQALSHAKVPADQIKQMNWNPEGNIAATMGRGATAIAQAQNFIADKLVKEYLQKRPPGKPPTLNGEPVPNLTDQDIDAAIKLSNAVGQRLPIDVAKTRETFKNLYTRAQRQATAQQYAASAPAAPAAAPATPATPAVTAKPKIQRLPGETMQAAIKRAQQTKSAPPSTGLSYPGGQPILPTDPVYAALKRQGKI